MGIVTQPQAGRAGGRPALAIHGASGRMGRQLLALAGDAGFQVSAAWVAPGSALLGGDAAPHLPGLRWSLPGSGERPAVVVDFSRAEAFPALLAWCRERGVALVSGTTGLDAGQRAEMARAAADIPVLWAANFSLGIAVLARLAALAGTLLPDWSTAVVEAHHAAKVDAPSGTALALGRVLAQARGKHFDEDAVRADPLHGCPDTGFAVVRAGDVVGEHSLLLVGAGERLELVHRAHDRAVFARGALHAARWLQGRAPGLYRLDDCLEPPPA